MIVHEPVQAAIWHCLNHYDHKNAVFLAERLCSEVETDETIFVLATSYYRANLVHQAYWLLKEKSRRSPQCRFLLAKCAFDLKKYPEAEAALINQPTFGDIKQYDDIAKDFGDTACFAFALMAKICIKTERNKIAVAALRNALKLNPFMWYAFAELCHLGEAIDPEAIFQIANTDIFDTCLGQTEPTQPMSLFGCSSNSNSNSSSSNDNENEIENENEIDDDNEDEDSTDLLLNENAAPLANSQDSPPARPSSASSEEDNPILCITRNTVSTPIDHQYLATPITTITSTTNKNQTESVQQRGDQNLPLFALDETPVGFNEELSFSSAASSDTSEATTVTPYRKSFRYLTTFSPTTPSFGVLPITSPNPESSFTSSTGNVQSTLNVALTPSPQSQIPLTTEPQPKLPVRKMRPLTGSLLHRKDTTANTGHTKPSVFTQTGNITPRTLSNPTGPPMRRSSRLFSNNYSVKENNKTPNMLHSKFAQPRSPPRKTKTRITKISFSNEVIEDKSATNVSTERFAEKTVKREMDTDRVETITSEADRSDPIEDCKVFLNNSYNTSQSYSNQLLGLKKQSAEGLMALMRDLGEGYKQLESFQCKSAIRHFETNVPKHHLLSSWVQSMIGMAYYEQREYEAAVAVFKRVHELDPFRLDYMEMYSSSLWHLQREVDLSALAQDVMNINKKSPITWCVAGNCFSLHKEHETAIKFFKRAVQVDPEFVYSFTLLGHELVLTEELDKALDYFRCAVLRDPRHYNAWFGIGTIYSKQEKYELAELHYIKALKINPQNSVILVHIGAMQYFMQKKELALQTLNSAALIDPKNPLARFHRGSIYFSLGRHHEALRELEELKEIVPKESVVFYLIGKIHKALGNNDLALMHFSWATDLDPKGANNQIKDAFDSMSHPSCCASGANDSSPEADGDAEAETEPELDADGDVEPVSERSEDSTQAQHDINYDSDAY